MSDINANIVVSPIDLNVTVSTNQLSFTPDAISLNLYAGGVGTSNSLTANIANVHIFGGVNGYVLQTDGTGNLTWTAQTGNGGGGNGTPGGSNTQVQYNDSGSFGGNVGFTFNEITGALNVPGNVTAPYFIGNASYATFAASATTVTASSQPNITSVGSLVSLTVLGNSNTGNIYTSGVSGNISGANVITANTFVGNFTGNLSGTFTGNFVGNLSAGNITSNANVNFTTASNVSLGAVGNVKITGGTANYVLKTDGAGNLSWVVQSSASGSNISNGTSNVNIPTSNGNVITSINGNNILFVTSTGLFVSSPGNITARQFISNVAIGNAPFVVTSTTTVANLSASTAGTVTTNAQPNITSVGVLSSLNVGNATGNLIVSNATGNWNITFNGNGNIYANTGFYVGNRIYANIIGTNQLVYANLPSFQGGTRAFISDANTRTFDSVVGGGGANYMPVWNDGTNWRVG